MTNSINRTWSCWYCIQGHVTWQWSCCETVIGWHCDHRSNGRVWIGVCYHGWITSPQHCSLYWFMLKRLHKRNVACHGNLLIWQKMFVFFLTFIAGVYGEGIFAWCDPQQQDPPYFWTYSPHCPSCSQGNVFPSPVLSSHHPSRP